MARDKTRSGIYFDPKTLSLEVIKYKDKFPYNVYPGYRQIPTLALLVVGPLLGASMVLFLPALGFVMFAGFSVSKLVSVAKRINVYSYTFAKESSEIK